LCASEFLVAETAEGFPYFLHAVTFGLQGTIQFVLSFSFAGEVAAAVLRGADRCFEGIRVVLAGGTGGEGLFLVFVGTVGVRGSACLLKKLLEGNWLVGLGPFGRRSCGFGRPGHQLAHLQVDSLSHQLNINNKQSRTVSWLQQAGREGPSGPSLGFLGKCSGSARGLISAQSELRYGKGGWELF
jgi:hypothetical protein